MPSPDPVASPTSAIPTPFPEDTLNLQPDPTSNATVTIEPTGAPIARVATANSVPESMVSFQPTSVPSPTIQSVAMAGTNAPAVMDARVLPSTSGTPSWLVVALAVQMVVLVGAGVEYVRRHWKR